MINVSLDSYIGGVRSHWTANMTTQNISRIAWWNDPPLKREGRYNCNRPFLLVKAKGCNTDHVKP